MILSTVMAGPEPSARAAADPRTVRIALELPERTVGCRRCRCVIAENVRKHDQAGSACTPCARAIEDDADQLETAPALPRRRGVCRTDIAYLRADAWTCGDAFRNIPSWHLRSRRRQVPCP